MYQALKYIFVRIGISLFLLFTFGFLTLYFVHEVALPGSAFDDSFIQWGLFFICLFIGTFAYGVVGEQKFCNAIHKLKNISSDVKSEEVFDGYQAVHDFTYSSYFLPGKGKRLRDNVILKFANYLLFVGRKDSRAQKIFLKAFLLRPEDSSYRTPLLSVFKEYDDLTNEEIDLLLVILQADGYKDDAIVNNLAALFIRKRLFISRTEPIFLASLKNKSEHSEDIINLVLPQLFKANRSDLFAVKFYLEARQFDLPEESQIVEIISSVYCNGIWKDVDPKLHQSCEKVFQSLDYKFKNEMLRISTESSLSGRIHQLKLLNESDLRLLKKLKAKIGLSKSPVQYLRNLLWELTTNLLGLTRVLISKFFMIRIWVFVLVIVFIASLLYRSLDNREEMNVRVDGKANNVMGERFVSSRMSAVHTFQVAAFTSFEQAKEFVDLLKKKGVRDVYQVKTKRRSGETWYKIRVGRFDSKENAQRFASQLIEQKTIKNYFLISLPVN